MDPGTAAPTGPCVLTDTAPNGDRRALIRVDCTDPALTALADKRHLVMVPANPTREVLWLHLGGSGGNPENTQVLGRVANAAGYNYISLAYPNARSINARCTCPDGPRPPECEEEVRVEVLYGEDVTDAFDMEPDEAIVPRLVALLKYLDQQFPNAGLGAYLSPGEPATPVWSKIAVSGFSQGGGMAGLIARDHAVDRALYLSKGAGAVAEAMVDAAAVQPCVDASACDGVPCCPLSDPGCSTPGANAYCLSLAPAPWAYTGRDVDGDLLGDGDASTRATSGAREFACVHREETAWAYSPAVFQAWGMGEPSAIVDVDTVPPADYGDAHVFSTVQAPNLPSCSEHQAMGADACHPRDPTTGEPVMAPAWRHAMEAALPPL